MESRGFYNEILTEHNLRPEFKHDLPDADIVLEGVNPSCGDDIWLKLKVDGDVITDGAFVGDYNKAIEMDPYYAHDQRRSIRRGD